MKKYYFLILLFTFLISSPGAFAWGGDVEVSIVPPEGATSVVAKSDGTLYASVPEISLNPSHAMSIYQSVDNGATWTQLNIGGGSPGQTVVKSKMLVTGIDTVVCVYLISGNIYTLDIASGSVSSFTTISAQDFDVAASPNSNSIYLFVDEAVNNNLKRYTSSDAGVTWTGTSALVSGDAARPRVYMTGTRLFLAYFGSVQSNVSLSKIVTAYYNESVPGTLVSVSGSFQDIVTNTTDPKNGFQPVGINGGVWFLWTEGANPSILKCRYSSDDGMNYGTEFVVAGSVTMNVERFDAKHFANLVNSGVQIAYYADSVQAGVADPFTESMMFTTAGNMSPQAFFTPQRISDYTVDGSDAAFNPTLVYYIYNFSETSGILWVQNDGNGPSLYYDATSSVVSIQEQVIEKSGLQVYPNPAANEMTVSFYADESLDYQLELVDVCGKQLLIQNKGVLIKGMHEFFIELSGFDPGIYFLRVLNSNYVMQEQIIKID